MQPPTFLLCFFSVILLTSVSALPQGVSPVARATPSAYSLSSPYFGTSDGDSYCPDTYTYPNGTTIKENACTVAKSSASNGAGRVHQVDFALIALGTLAIGMMAL
ncbi:MAG: hypothetical protein M1834_001029 [Cirrosporium novae-zelandiae]|nr:MAG: hypothetical protein M1834_001029 [Cirrosporium novae-zelandiae]